MMDLLEMAKMMAVRVTPLGTLIVGVSIARQRRTDEAGRPHDWHLMKAGLRAMESVIKATKPKKRRGN